MKSHKITLSGIALIISGFTTTSHAQWTVKESDFTGSPLEQTYKTSPYLVHVMPDEQWNSSNFASPKDMEWFEDVRYGMYIHFGLSSFKNRDLSWGVMDGVLPDASQGAYPREEWTSWPDSLVLDKFSAEELADIIRRSGMKYVMVVAKHHDGFHLYDTKYSDFNIMHTPYGKDFVGEVIKACRMADAKVGIYFSQRDWYHTDYAPIDPETAERQPNPPYFKAKAGKEVRPGKSHQKYIDYMFNTVRELCTNYGKIDMFNFDASYWDGMFTADMWDAERLTRMIRELQPGIIINNRASLPGDYDSPEQRIGMFQDHRMWETCMCLCDTWSYSPSRVKDSKEVFRNIQSTAIGNGNLLLSWGMKWNGEWDGKQKESLLGAGDFLRTYGESIYKTHGGPWLPAHWGGSTYNGKKIYLHILNPGKESIRLAKIPGVDIRYAKTLTGQEGISFRETAEGYEVECGNIGTDALPLIVELKASRKLSPQDILRNENNKDLFADTQTYGTRLCSQSFDHIRTAVIDLNGPKNLKGIRLTPQQTEKPNDVTISLLQEDGSWKTYKKTSYGKKGTDVPVSSFLAGILKEGILTTKVRLEFESSLQNGITCECYGN